MKTEYLLLIVDEGSPADCKPEWRKHRADGREAAATEMIQVAKRSPDKRRVVLVMDKEERDLLIRFLQGLF